eukprot:gene57659-biopygen47572
MGAEAVDHNRRRELWPTTGGGSCGPQPKAGAVAQNRTRTLCSEIAPASNFFIPTLSIGADRTAGHRGSAGDVPAVLQTAAVESTASASDPGPPPPPPILGISIPQPFRCLCVYLSIHNGRRIAWQLNMGSADLKFSAVGGRKYEINVHTLQMMDSFVFKDKRAVQMVLLLLFNRNEKWTLEQLAEEIKVPLPEVKKQAMSLTRRRGQRVHAAVGRWFVSKGIGVGSCATCTKRPYSVHYQLSITASSSDFRA